MTQKYWVMALVGIVCLIGVQAASVTADEGEGKKMRGQMQSGHEQGEQGEHSGHYLKHLLKHAKELGLTSEQISKLKAMQLDFKRTQARTEADIKIARLELHALLEEEQGDFSAIQAKVDQLKKTEGELLLAAIKSRRDATALLTPDQREKDRAHREKMMSEGEGQHRGGKGRGGMGGGGQGGSGGEHGSGEQGGGQQHQH
jgi:periplasmic protein CpxP/Spy